MLRSFLKILFFLLAIAPAHSREIAPLCPPRLREALLADSMARFDLQPNSSGNEHIQPYNGITLSWNETVDPIPRKTVMTTTHFPLESKSSVKAISDGRLYEIENVGFKNLESDYWDVMDETAQQHKAYPDKNLIIRFKGAKKRIYEYLWKWRWAAHERVLGVYRHAKEHYIDERGFGWLEFSNQIHSSSDVFIVRKSGPKPTSKKGIENDILLTAQLSYEGESNLFFPDFLHAPLEPKLEGAFDLPFGYRLAQAERNSFWKSFRENFKGKKIAEITRYASPGTVPRSVHSAMLLTMINTGLERGVTLFVASVDESTIVQFARYGFSTYKEIPARQNYTKEFLIFIDVESDFFKTFKSGLEAQASNSNPVTSKID